MTRHGKRRIAVRSEGKYVGFLEDIDLLGLFAGNSQLIPGRIDRARSPEDLLGPARDIQAQVERLHRQGVKVDAIAEITSDLNRRLFAKLFDMLAPPSIKEAGCLLLMGSEGRGEQTVRTDQDNALLLSAEVPEAELAAFREGFTRALEGFGFPPCPGNVMVRNPHWSQPIKGFVRQLAAWVRARDPEAAMNIAIFCDAIAVAGHAKLLVRARTALTEMLQGEAVLLARFANLVESFATPTLGVLSTLMASVGVGSDEIDIKKAGTFPIVHGIRTLAVEQRCPRLLHRRAHRGAGRDRIARARFRARARQRASPLHGISPALAARGDAARREPGPNCWCTWASSRRWTVTSCAMHSGSCASCATSSTTTTVYGVLTAMSGPLRRLFYRATLGDHRYRFLFEAGPKGELVSLDCETTGLNPRTDEIIAVAAVRIRGNRILTSERFEEIVRPETGSRSGSIKVHQLRAIDVEKGRPMHKVLPDLLRFIGGRPLVGYYIDFDVRMLDKYVLEPDPGQAAEPADRGLGDVLCHQVQGRADRHQLRSALCHYPGRPRHSEPSPAQCL